MIPALGSRRLVDLTSEEIDAWLAAKGDALDRYASSTVVDPPALNTTRAGGGTRAAECRTGAPSVAVAG